MDVLNTIQTLTPIIVAIFASGGFWEWMRKRSEKDSAQLRLLCGLGFREIVKTCDECLDNGEIETETYKELNHYLFEPYQELGGDGTAAKLIKEVEKLPISRKETHHE